MSKQKYYVVWVGRNPGIYRTWDDCKAQTDHFPNAKFKSYSTLEEAEAAYQLGYEHTQSVMNVSETTHLPEINYNSISVDAGSSGNPGIVEYRGVDTRTGEVLFYKGPISKGTNNLAEFLAIVHALAYIKKEGSDKIIYSDSQTAIQWVKNKQVNSDLVRDETTEEIWNLVDRALKWLNSNTYSTPILKWNTTAWGQIKADFGRK